MRKPITLDEIIEHAFKLNLEREHYLESEENMRDFLSSFDQNIFENLRKEDWQELAFRIKEDRQRKEKEEKEKELNHMIHALIIKERYSLTNILKVGLVSLFYVSASVAWYTGLLFTFKVLGLTEMNSSNIFLTHPYHASLILFLNSTGVLYFYLALLNGENFFDIEFIEIIKHTAILLLVTFIANLIFLNLLRYLINFYT